MATAKIRRGLEPGLAHLGIMTKRSAPSRGFRDPADAFDASYDMSRHDRRIAGVGTRRRRPVKGSAKALRRACRRPAWPPKAASVSRDRLASATCLRRLAVRTEAGSPALDRGSACSVAGNEEDPGRLAVSPEGRTLHGRPKGATGLWIRVPSSSSQPGRGENASFRSSPGRPLVGF